TSGFISPITTLNPAGGSYGTSSGPANQINRATNYSGTSTLWGDIVALSTGPCNVLYAAVSASMGATGVDASTTGLFPAPSAFSGGTASMVISFADCRGAFDSYTGLTGGQVGVNIGGILPVADGFADPASSSVTTITPGVNNFRVFVLGNGPDIRSTS